MRNLSFNLIPHTSSLGCGGGERNILYAGLTYFQNNELVKGGIGLSAAEKKKRAKWELDRDE